MAHFNREMRWSKFYFAGQPIRESSKSISKTVAKNSKQQGRRERETGFRNLSEVRHHRIRYLRDVVEEYLVAHRLTYRSATFAVYALGHVSRMRGAELIADIDEAAARYRDNLAGGSSLIQLC